MHIKTEEFLEIFNRLEDDFHLKLHKNAHISIGLLVNEAAKRDPYIRKKRMVLKSLIDLRNVLVHEEGNAIYAIPSDEALTALKEIQEEYHKPRKVYDLLKKPVERVEANQRLSYVLGLMKETNFSQLPAYDGDRFIGLVNGNVISRWLASNLDMGGNLIKNLGSVDIRHVLDFQENATRPVSYRVIWTSMNSWTMWNPLLHLQVSIS